MVLTLEQLNQRIDGAPLAQQGDRYQFAFFAMGTSCQVMYQAPSPAVAHRFKEHVARWLAQFEADFSRFRPDSVIGRINALAGVDWVEIDPETESLFRLCDWFHWTTRGLFDPTTLPLLRLWDYHQEQPRLPSSERIAEARAQVGWTRFLRKDGAAFLPEKGMGLDLGGIGKEYAVDRVTQFAIDFGLPSALVDFGRDVRVLGEPPERGPWRIGLEDPADTGKCWGGVAATDRAVCTSGDYARNICIDGKLYGHIVDPRTGYPVANGSHSVTVIAPTCTDAGVLSTTAFVMGVPSGLEFLEAFPQAEGCVCTEKEKYFTRGFHDYLV